MQAAQTCSAECGNRSLTQGKSIAFPVRIVELGQDRDLVERQAGTCPEREAKPELESVISLHVAAAPAMKATSPVT